MKTLFSRACCIRACGWLHGADICCRRPEDQGRLSEGPHEVGQLNQDLFIGVLTKKSGGSLHPPLFLHHQPETRLN